MNSSIFSPIPADTSDAAHSVFNIENVYLTIGDQVEALFDDLDLADLDVSGSQRSGSPSLLAMVTIFQFAENLPDRLAIEALQTRMDWKYALHLSLIYPGLDQLALCEFRQRMLFDTIGQEVFQIMLLRLAELGLISSRVKSWADACSVLLTDCKLSRVDHLWQGMNLVLEALATYHPEFIREVALPHWYERYQLPPAAYPRSSEDLEELAKAIGNDMRYLLETIPDGAEPGVAQLPEMLDLGKVWHQQFTKHADQETWRVYCSFCSGVNSKTPVI